VSSGSGSSSGGGGVGGSRRSGVGKKRNVALNLHAI